MGVWWKVIGKNANPASYPQKQDEVSLPKSGKSSHATSTPKGNQEIGGSINKVTAKDFSPKEKDQEAGGSVNILEREVTAKDNTSKEKEVGGSLGTFSDESMTSLDSCPKGGGQRASGSIYLWLHQTPVSRRR